MTLDTITGILNDKQDITNQLSSNPTVVPVVKQFNEKLQIKQQTTKQILGTYNTSNNIMIWGESTYGIWGTDNWGTYENAYDETLYAVIPNNNVYVEYFLFSDYIDTVNSTGTLNTTNQTYTLDNLEVLQTEVIAKLREPITSVLFREHEDFVNGGMVLPFTLGVSTFGAGVTIQASNDGGSNWFTITEGVKYTFASSSPSDELKVKLINNGTTITISKPIYIEVNK